MFIKLKKDKRNFFSGLVPVACRLSVKKGVTLVEIMIAMSLMSIGILGMIGSFTYLNRGLQVTKGRTLANNLAQEKIELLKNYSYYRVLVTTETTTDSNFDPAIEYDTYPNGMEEIGAGGINFKRYVLIRKLKENSGELDDILWDQPDEGLKRIVSNRSPRHLYLLITRLGRCWNHASNSPTRGGQRHLHICNL